MNRARSLVLAALALVVLLGATLGVRLAGLAQQAPAARPALARWEQKAPSARVPEPIRIDVPKVPCWSCPQSEKWPVTFQTNLDVLAPLGDGSANAALWLKDFARPQGARLEEAKMAMKRRVEGPGSLGLVLPPDDPLLEEAEPWADQATMRFYPDVWTAEGASTPIPDLLVAITLSRSWVARASSDPDSPQALENCRRAIRWGRLLRQEDATVIQDLVGLASIRLGADQLYVLAARRGDRPLMLAAAIVLGEAAPQRLRTAEVLTNVAFGDQASVPDKKVDEAVRTSRASPDRRFRCEAIVTLAFSRLRGTPAQREKSRTALEGLRDAPDAFVADQVRWALGLRAEDLPRLAAPDRG